MSETRIDLRQDPETWDKPDSEKHTFRVERNKGFMLEAEDLQFQLNSAVFLPDYRTLNEPVPPDEQYINGVAVIRSTLLHVQDHSDQKLLIVGHADRSGQQAYNLDLSRLRARSVLAALVGDRDDWVAVAVEKSRVIDYQIFLNWVSRTWGWDCDPVDIDDIRGNMTRTAVESFQAAYNEFFDQSISVDGDVGKQTWGAMFDIFTRELATSLDVEEDELQKFRSKISFVSDANKAVGVGEHFPKDRMTLDGYRSAADRRVELLFYEPKYVPFADEYPTTDTCVPEKVHIYNPMLYDYDWLYVDPVPALVWLDLQTIDELGYRVANAGLKLTPVVGEPSSITTDDIGYWSGRVLAGNKIRVTTADGKPVRFGTSKDGDLASGRIDDTAVVTPSVAPRVITDIVVPTVSTRLLREHHEQVNRYGRHPESQHTTTRSGGNAAKVGEEMRETSSRGAEDRKSYTRRSIGSVIADNLFIAAGFESSANSNLQNHVKTWLNDHHPSAVRRGYFLQLAHDRGITVYDHEKKKLGDYPYREGVEITGRIGIHAMLMFYGASNSYVFADMNSQTSGIGREGTGAPPESDQQDSPDSSKANEVSATEPPPQNEDEKDFHISELLDPGARDDYMKTVRSQVAKRRVELLYLLYDVGTRYHAARYGGTGLLENYPEDSGMHGSIHHRNKKVAENIGVAYSGYIKWYIDQVKKIPDKAPRGQINAEIQLHRLGPPDSTFQFPVPIGCSTHQYRDILNAFLEGEYYSEFNAWQAITEKLNAIRGKRSEGSVWFTVEFSAEAGNFAGPLSGASVKLNFEATSEGKVSAAAEKEVPLTVGSIPKSLGAEIPVKMQFKKNKDTGRVDSKVSFNVGKYGIEAESNGNIKMSYGPASQEWNQSSAIGGMGVEVSLRDLVAKGMAKGSEVPKWVDDLPDVKAKAAIGFRLSTQGTILKVAARSPGFFEMRPRVDFSSLDWATLHYDERGALDILGFDQQTWDDRKRTPATNKQFIGLSGDEKMAAIMIPIPTTDPEWLKYWFAWEQRKVG
jgi:hypothetical protein